MLPKPRERAHRHEYGNLGTPLGDLLTITPGSPSPTTDNTPRIPPRNEQANIRRMLQSTTTSPVTPDTPPLYATLIPKPFMNGFMDKASGENVGKNLLWTRKFVEVSKGVLTFYDSKDQRDADHGVALPLSDSFVSFHDRRTLEIKGTSGIRLFRTTSELRANKWFHVISLYCSVAPVAEGYCQKLSSRKNVLEDRYLKLTTDGILSWYKGEDDSDPRGAIQIRGENLSLDKDDSKVLFVHTKERRYHFQLLDESDSQMWLSVLDWHTQLSPPSFTSISVRNASLNKN